MTKIEVAGSNEHAQPEATQRLQRAQVTSEGKTRRVALIACVVDAAWRARCSRVCVR